MQCIDCDDDEGEICERCYGDGWITTEYLNCKCPDCKGDGRVWFDS